MGEVNLWLQTAVSLLKCLFDVKRYKAASLIYNTINNIGVPNNLPALIRLQTKTHCLHAQVLFQTGQWHQLANFKKLTNLPRKNEKDDLDDSDEDPLLLQAFALWKIRSLTNAERLFVRLGLTRHARLCELHRCLDYYNNLMKSTENSPTNLLNVVVQSPPSLSEGELEIEAFALTTNACSLMTRLQGEMFAEMSLFIGRWMAVKRIKQFLKDTKKPRLSLRDVLSATAQPGNNFNDKDIEEGEGRLRVEWAVLDSPYKYNPVSNELLRSHASP